MVVGISIIPWGMRLNMTAGNPMMRLALWVTPPIMKPLNTIRYSEGTPKKNPEIRIIKLVTKLFMKINNKKMKNINGVWVFELGNSSIRSSIVFLNISMELSATFSPRLNPNIIDIVNIIRLKIKRYLRFQT